MTKGASAIETVAVAVAVLRRADGRVLVAYRDAARHQGGALEFPGGKIEPGERPEQALSRELEEEVGVRPTRTEPLMRLRHAYSDRQVELDVFLVRAWEGEPRGAEGQRIDWLEPGGLAPERFPAANRPITAVLRLPAYYLITPAPSDGSARQRERIVDGVRTAVNDGIRLVQLRAHGLDAGTWHALVDAVSRVTGAEPDCHLLVNAPAAAAADLPPGAGLHLSAAGTRALTERPIGRDRLFACSCHDAQELAAATRGEADLAVLGPVHPTPSHPEAAGIGWQAFAGLAATTTLPLYALGGVVPEDLSEARSAGAVGVAAIRGLWPAG